MNTIVTSREEILKASRKLAMEKGWKAVRLSCNSRRQFVRRDACL